MELDNKYIFFHFYSDIKYQFLIWAVIQTNQVSEKDNRGYSLDQSENSF